MSLTTCKPLNSITLYEKTILESYLISKCDPNFVFCYIQSECDIRLLEQVAKRARVCGRQNLF